MSLDVEVTFLKILVCNIKKLPAGRRAATAALVRLAASQYRFLCNTFFKYLKFIELSREFLKIQELFRNQNTRRFRGAFWEFKNNHLCTFQNFFENWTFSEIIIRAASAAPSGDSINNLLTVSSEIFHNIQAIFGTFQKIPKDSGTFQNIPALSRRF